MLSGEWIDRIIGLENVTVETVMARAPDGSDMFEVVRPLSFRRRSRAGASREPSLGSGTSPSRSTTCVASSTASEAGFETVGEIVDFENTFLLCYVRGPEGLIVELAERLDGAPG